MNPTAQPFCVGPLSFRFDGATGFVRHICFHGHEVLRGIYPAVRDDQWGTLPPKAEQVEIHSTADCLRLSLKARVLAPEMDLAWTAEIEAHASGQLEYRWRGNSARNCKTNRTGLCVLHAAELAGAPCVVEHTDGSKEDGWFPSEISPHQPFRDIRALTHLVGEYSQVAVRLEGEVFEMEDQRNWTDASFKTYCRPLAWPYPYCLESGAELEQSVTFRVLGRVQPMETQTAPVGPRKERTLLRLPGLGFTLPGPIPPPLRDRVRALCPAHVRVETTLDTLPATLEWATPEAKFLDCTLVLAIRGAGVRSPGPSSLPSRCTMHLFDEAGNTASSETLAAWRRAGHTSLATGTLHNFAELNRNRPPADAAHTLTVFGINAQAHAADNDSILETLSQHAPVACAAYRIGAGRPVAVAPISLGRRTDSADPRLHTEFGAQWLLQSQKRLAESGCVESVTYFHAHGPVGFMDEAQVTPIEQLLLALAGRTTMPSDFSLPA